MSANFRLNGSDCLPTLQNLRRCSKIATDEGEMVAYRIAYAVVKDELSVSSFVLGRRQAGAGTTATSVRSWNALDEVAQSKESTRFTKR